MSMSAFSLLISSCKSNDVEDDPKGCNYKLDIAYKWYNTYTTIDTYSDESRTKKTETSVVSPVGFLKIDPNGTYEIVNDDVAQIGTWEINKETCRLVLGDKAITAVAVQYDILNLSTKELVVKRAKGAKVYTEHYKTANCPTNTELSKQWDNKKTFYFQYNSSTNTINNPYLVYPVGYFKLNTDLTYNVLSDGVPLNGSWKLGQPYCLLDLDLGKQNARSFEVVKLTTDSLVIWRKDANTSLAYLQYYLKH